MKLLFPGSFDPFTSGHANLVERALKFADSVVIAIGVNESKKCMYTSAERLKAIEQYYVDNPRVKVMEYSGLTMDMAHNVGADAILRGVRSVNDFETEQELAAVNASVGGVETVVLYADNSLQHVSSSMVRELSSFGRPVNEFIVGTFPEKKNDR